MNCSNTQKTIIEIRNDTQKKAEDGLISPSDYYKTLKDTWNKMSTTEKKIESARIR